KRLPSQEIENRQQQDVKGQGKSEGGERRGCPVQTEGEPFAQEVLQSGTNGTQERSKKAHRPCPPSTQRTSYADRLPDASYLPNGCRRAFRSCQGYENCVSNFQSPAEEEVRKAC